VLVGAFHHLSAVSLISDADVLDHEDVLVCGDDAAKQSVIELAATVTCKPGIDAGAHTAPGAPARAADRPTDLDQQEVSGARGHRCGRSALTRVQAHEWHALIHIASA
jgi:hypothetical protein